MKVDRTALVAATLAASIAGAVVLTASLPAFAGDHGSGAAEHTPPTAAASASSWREIRLLAPAGGHEARLRH